MEVRMGKVFLPKDDQAIPDHYGITIHYINGHKDDFEVAEHRIIEKTRTYCVGGDFQDEATKERFKMENSVVPYLELVLKEDTFTWIPLSSIQRLDFDKRFTKIIELKKKKAAESGK